MSKDIKYGVGDTVWWGATSGGQRTNHCGKIVAVVGAGRNPTRALAEAKYAGSTYALRNCGMPRDHLSYVVSAPRTKDGRGERLYWPRVKALVLMAARGDAVLHHMSDCATHNEPAMKAGPCDCVVGTLDKGEQK
jgi:hypothetical protein